MLKSPNDLLVGIWDRLRAKDPRRPRTSVTGGFEDTFIFCGADVQEAIREAFEKGYEAGGLRREP